MREIVAEEQLFGDKSGAAVPMTPVRRAEPFDDESGLGRD
jgi:hypothetical protein